MHNTLCCLNDVFLWCVMYCGSSQVQKTLNLSCSWLISTFRKIWITSDKIDVFSVFTMLGECYPWGIESRSQGKSGALVIYILQLSPLLAGLLSFLCSSVWTWFISLSITLFIKFLKLFHRYDFFQVEFLLNAFHLIIYARITEIVFEKWLFLLYLSPLKLTPRENYLLCL